MIEILENVSLKNYNTFGINVKAKILFQYRQPSDISNLLKKGLLNKNTEMIILGGGSNQLFTSDYKGLILHPVNDTITLAKENNDFVWIKADAGLEWDKLVGFAVEKGYGGIENLSNIPGNIGAAPVQNIGAYGVEAKDTIETVHLVNLNDGSEKELTNAECEFAYRNSIFKNQLKNQYLVDAVTFKLSKRPEFIIHYGSVKDELKKLGTVNLKTIRQTIIKIRESKLPNHKEIGNGGSFFKNPVVSAIVADNLTKTYAEMPIYDANEGMKKLAAGWLIEKCGLKGYTNEKQTAGIHEKQALVIINKGGASGQDIIDVANLVKSKVFEKFNIHLEPEVIFV